MDFDINAFLKENKAGVSEEEPQLITSEAEPAKQTAFDINAFLQENAVSPTSARGVKETKPSGTSFGEEVSQLGSAFVESIGRPLENMGESFESFGFSGVANALKGAITEPENYVSAGQRFMEPAPDEAQLMGFAWQYAPRAAVEQVGQAIGAIGTRAVGAAAGGAVAGPPGAIAGGFLGPAVFGAAQVIGPVAKERAMNNGREVPNNSDLVAATLTAIGSGSLDAIGAKYLPGGDKATGKFFKRVASAFAGEGLLTEAPQSVIEQIGATAGTEKGLNINVKQAVGEGLIGGTSAAGLTAIVSPFSKPAENQVIRTPEEAEELDINAKANQEAVLLMGDPADQTQNERVTKLKEIESVIANNETLMTGLEPNAPERSKLDLENRVAKKEAEKLKAEITQGAGLSETITEAERQQIELAKAIITPAAPAEAAPEVAAPVTEAITPLAEVAPSAPVAEVAPPTEPTIKEALPVAPEAPAITPTPVAETPTVAPAAEVAPTIEPLTDDQAETIRDVITLRKSQGREPNPEQVKRLAEYDARKAGVDVQEGDIISNIVVGHPMFEAPQPELSNLVPIKVQNKEQLTSPIQRTQQVRDAAQSYIGQYQVEQAKAKTPAQKKAFAKKFNKSELDRQRDILDYIKNDVMPELDRLEKSAPSATPAVSETITPAAEPAGISVGNRIKLGKSPQTYIVEEVVPQTEAEKANDEQYYSVKNERTGETQVVEKADMKQVGGKRARKMAAEVIPKQESVTPIPESNRYTFKEAVKAVDAHFGKKGIPEGVVIVNNTTDPDLEMKAGYFVNRGQIVINLAYIAKGENLGDIIDHELGHYIFGDPEFQADFKQFWNLMTPEEKAKADQIINQFYNKETGAIQMEEKQVRAFMQLIQDSKAMPKWKQLLDKIKRWINEKLGTNLQVNDRGALAVLAAAHKRFKSGEKIVREIDSGVLKSAETAQDAEYLAAVERGDMETAQRMVDEAAKAAGYFLEAFHGSPEENITQFKNPTWVAKDRDYSKGYTEKYALNEDYDLTGGITYQGKGKVYDFFVKTDKTLKLWKYKDWVDLVEKLDPNNDKLKSAILEFQPVQNKIKTWENFKKETFKYREEVKKTGQEYFAWNTDGHDLSSTWQEYNASDANFINKIELVNALFDLGFDTLGQIESSETPTTGAAYLVKNPSKQIKSADPVTYDDAGNVIPLSQRFQPSEPDIRRMAVEPSGERQQIMGEKIGPLKKTPEGIIAETQAKLRERFDPTKVTEQNTTEAFRALGRLTGKEGTAFAQELNDIGRMVDESGAAAEVSMGAALFVNDLFEYAVRLAAEGQKMMLGIMMTNINRLPTGTEGRSDAGRALRAAREMKDTFLTMAQAEQDAFINYAAEFVYGPNPTKEQVDSIQIGYDAVEKVQEPTTEEVEEEIAAVGKKTGTDLVGKINEEFTKATEKGKEKRKTESEDLDAEYKKVQMKAESEIEKLAKIQSDTPAFARQVVNEIRAIIANDLKQRPDMESKAQWKSSLVDKLQNAGVEPSRAERLADLVWRQHEINNLSREIDSINKAIEKGPISEIVKAIKETPLEEQQKPNWRYEVMRDYLRKAGLSLAQAERIAKLMDISLQKRFTQAKEQAFTDAISKTAPWKAGDVRSKRAFQQVIQAIRSGALDPSRNMASDIAALNGWTGFSPDQYKNLLKNDAILADPKSGELQKAEAYKAIQDIISKSKLPIRARDVIGQYYDAQALSGIPTLTVNSFSPIAFAMRNAIVEASSGTIKGDAKAIGRAATAFVDSIKSWANTVAFSFKNNVTVYSNVDYIVNDDNLLRLYRKGVDQFTKSKNAKERADGVKNMMVGMMDYVRRILNALDYGAIAALQNQNISKYAMAVMKRQKMNDKQANEMFGVMMKAKNDFYLQQIAIGTDKNKASILADEFYISSWKKSLEKEGVKEENIKSAMDAAINDALSSVGRNRQSLDAFKEEATNLKDAGMASSPALWLLESVANAANRSDSQFIKVFSRVIYGFAIVPARVIRETAWFSPYGFVRIMVDAALKNRNIESRYAQSLGSDFQRQQRLNEAIAGTVALFGLMALRAGSTDDPEDEDEFKIVFTGNGPQRKDDAQFYDSWYKAGNKPNSMILSFGKTKFTLNMMRGFEAFTWPAMMLGALDDLEIRKKQKQQTKTPGQLEDAAIVAGFVFDAALRRGPYAFTTKSLFGTYGDIGVEGVAKGLTFPAKTLIPVLGTSIASNLSNFLNDPIDRRTLDGAVWSNIPFIGPAVAPKSLNAFGEPSLSTDFASKMFKLGVPIVYDIPTDRESIKLHELVLKQGGGPSIPTRNQLAQRLDRQPTNKEYEMFVREYGTILTTSMKKNYDKLFNAKPEFYSKAVERIGNRARDVAENKVRQAAKKP